MSVEDQVQQFRKKFNRIKVEVQKRIIGQDDVVEGILICLFANGHALIEGVPGLGKTRMVQTLSEVLDLSFKRIQFTPDMMPSDITGTTILVEDQQGRKQFQFQPGPIFSQVILADEINRSTPRTQSALLEAMQERTVTIARTTHKLESPFCVFATQNPIEMDGTYPLPEAQLDRFLFKLKIEFPDQTDLIQIMQQTTSDQEPEIESVCDAGSILQMQRLIRQVPVADHVAEYASQIVTATHADQPNASEMAQNYVELGASVRGLQAIILAAKIKTLLDGRYNVATEDIQSVALPALRHRLLINFEGQSEQISTDEIITDVLTTQEIRS
ncbi:TPA: MoxR family ATPase [Candidatus Poribacteria bacterium]|nr:MoxR family ATPase [Candidatus Poribacteria bacterium]HIA67127.1 MoxR family ATPase [Candidatus Poribacteria bacterium]HIC01140.1 MoxR family ATPase [Candidatus Poribacteria bacterium]HIN27816.1 MoxR family ATPase [Candidatus Poribacteria bacterium]HIO46159.1 MoxR family ATPase [Candidatus Poribacteria bacterium]